MALITVSNLSFAYEGSSEYIFKDVSFSLDTRWKLGFIGRNGRGKTTFLRLLMGDHEYTGTIAAPVSFQYFPFEAPGKNRPGLEIIDELYPDYQYWRLAKELALLDFPEDLLRRPFETLSGGEQAKLLLAGLFLNEDNFLLLDEPTSHLDARTRETINAYLEKKQGFILVSHDRHFLDKCVDHVLSINRGDIEIQKGNFSSWKENRDSRDASELARNESLQKDIRRLTESARRSAGWSDKIEKNKTGGYRIAGLRPDTGYIGHQAAKMMKRSKAVEDRRQRALEEKQGLLKNIERGDELFMRPLKHHAERLIALENVSVSYGGEPVIRNISFTLAPGERIALAGRNGSGKTSLIRLIIGEEQGIRHTGKVYRAGGLVISRVAQDTDFLKGNIRDFALAEELDESRLKTLLAKLGFSREDFDTPLEDQSQGQKKKVLIAASLCRDAHLYIWDEPLNYIDVLSRVQIQDLVLSAGPSLLFVEHDRAFTEAAATRVVEL